jgi:hypothetical protein
MKSNSPSMREIELDLSGSSTFGRDPKIMASRTFNMILSDGWFVDYGGYEKVLSIFPSGKGRGIFSSKSNRIIVVISNRIYSVEVYSTSIANEVAYNVVFVSFINSFSGDVFMDENDTNQIAICDKHNIYIYNYITTDFRMAILPEGFNPGYVTYQDGRFIAPDTQSASWALSQVGNGLDWFWGDAGNPVLGALQTKADFAIATLRVPGRGNLLYVMGHRVTELWTDIGAPIFPYQRSTSVNYDYGCLNPATLASLDDIVVWLGGNEKSGPFILYSTGGEVKQISTDGINYKLSQLNNPEKSAGFMVKMAGHTIYQLTFYDPSDNYSLIYDFTTQKFFDVTDENMNFHIARRMAFFNNDYYFVSFSDGNLYRMAPELSTYDYGTFSDNSKKIYEIPRVRVCKNIRLPDSSAFIVNNMNFVLEQGNDTQNVFNGDENYQPRIGLSISRNGGISYGSYINKPIYKSGRHINRINYWGLGRANDFVPQFRYWGKAPWKASNGVVSYFQ